MSPAEVTVQSGEMKSRRTRSGSGEQNGHGLLLMSLRILFLEGFGCPFSHSQVRARHSVTASST
jgi:hypothetical protein